MPSSGVFPHREAARAVLEAVRSQVLSQRSGTPRSRDVEAVGSPGAGGWPVPTSFASLLLLASRVVKAASVPAAV